ncbi:MAG: glycosyltransferase [Bacteroidia bacterium]|nr:glycosyltransferase [Bacteroidia bacterium]NNF32282.1 glycosyltransferase [Flavobacteriaceae bacterium]MBT8276924.1 glycosyltransferase [Bacteroidia bacterium]NNJ83295.1 glycosyltransferase [Flavobacteriaceae bacterium]NNK53759.1 glycosyltransferase [Flavobacteriaceae bacterium]
MKILLVGEYSRLHNSLKEGLLVLGHNVTLISTGDFFKKYPSDIILKRKFDRGFAKKIKVGIFKLTGIDITSYLLKKQFFKHSKHLKGYDVVQLINESPFAVDPKIETELISFLKEYNKKLFLLSCGTDYLSVQFAMSDTLPYNILYEYKSGNIPATQFRFILKYTKPEFKKLHEHVFSVIDGVIASDMDYHLPLKDHPLYKGLIPNPVNITRLPAMPQYSEGPIVIFLGINRDNYHSKGIRFFEEALEIVSEKYSDKIEIQVVENLPYTEYIERFNKAHILLDQVLGYDQGYNALEAMAKGKVVFTGADELFENYYNLTNPVAVNALPDPQQIAGKLEELILHPERITEIGRNAREFVEREHDYKLIAERYTSVWNAN